MEEKIQEGNILDQNKKLKVFISYSHLDNSPEKQYIETFKKHLAPLKNSGLIEEWYDRYILGGEDFHKIIGRNLEKADIICLFISANFLDSSECMGEKRKAIVIKKMKGIPVVPIILSPCGWTDDSDLSELLALPTDGKPVTGFSDKDAAWHDVYEGMKKIIKTEHKIKQLSLNDQFKSFLYDAELLAKAHSKKETVSLKDIYIDTELEKIDISKRNSVTINSDELVDNLFSEKNIIISGEDQSGKTTLCKRMFCELRRLNFIPVFVSGKKTILPGKIENIIKKSLHEQYNNFNENEIDLGRIIPIVDDFHYAKDREKRIKNLLKYPLCIVIVDDTFSLNFKDETLIASFIMFKTKELKPSIRFELVKKWESLSDKDIERDYKDIDKSVALINTVLGRNIGKGLVPAYPFFILTALVTYETFTLSLEQDITSQGYCYQAIIYYYLRKRGVKNDEIDIYSNFLGELASYMHHVKQNELSYHDFSVFMNKYTEKYNLPIKPDMLLTNLSEIVSKDSLNNYSFRYPCFYYYFVAKSLSEHIEEPDGMERIKNIINNLQVDENAYIAVFLIHHSKNISIFNKIESISSSLFDKFKPATFTKDEMSFCDREMHNIIKAVMPPADVTPEMARAQELKRQDEWEQSRDYDTKDDSISESEAFVNDFRKAIKTVEVMGCIIRNRAGSLEKVKLQNIFLDGINVHLRISSCLIDTIKGEDKHKAIIDVISTLLSKQDEGKDPNQRLSEDERKKIAQIIYSNIIFFIVHGIIYKIVHSLGSEKLIEISNYVCDQVNNPATALIKHGILMEYEKNLQVDELHRRINEHDFSEIAKRSAEVMVVYHCSLNPVNYRDRQRIESTLKISRSRLK